MDELMDELKDMEKNRLLLRILMIAELVLTLHWFTV